MYKKNVQAAKIPLTDVKLLEESVDNGMRTLRLKLTPTRKTFRTSAAVLSKTPLILVEVDGTPIDGNELEKKISIEHKDGYEFQLSVYGLREKRIELKSGKILEPDLIVWTGGVRGDPACGLDFDIKSRRIVIDEFCRVLGYDNIYVAGDSACATNDTGQPVPPTAHIAMVQGDIVSYNVESSLLGGTMKPYKNRHIGEIVTLGRTNAIGELYGIKYVGLLAKIMKKIVHLWYVYSIGGISLLLGI